MKNKHKMAKAKRAEGGKVNEYNAQGSPEAKEAKDETAEFKRGGHKMKEGGHVHGHKSAKRLDKRARGGRTGGHSPYSSAKGGSDAMTGGAGNGREMNAPSD